MPNWTDLASSLDSLNPPDTPNPSPNSDAKASTGLGGPDLDKLRELIGSPDELDPSAKPSKNKNFEISTSEYHEASQETLELLSTTPSPFIEPTEVKPYAVDSADNILPSPSFVTDFVNLGRGTEAPTIFLIWGALWTLSAALNRNAWLEWYPKNLWPNLYVLFVAPAGLCKKSTPIDFGRTLLEASNELRIDTIDTFENEYRFVTSKSSPQGIYMMLKPDKRIFLHDRKIARAERSSKLTLCISELATLISKQQYMTGLVNDITDLYDSRERGEVITEKRGVEPLEKIYLTMAGAITPTGLEESVPPEMLKGGLISRMVIVYQDMPSKIYPRPIQIPGYPTLERVSQKLAWIAHNCRGEYRFAEEAETAFSDWYTEWKARVISGDLPLREDEHRRDITLRKIAMLLRVAEYRPGFDITLRNFEEAKRILDYTLALSSRMVMNIGGNEFAKKLERVKSYMAKKGTLTRRQLLNRYGGQIPSAEVTILLNQLLDQGYISGELNGISILHASGSHKETYTVTTPEEIYGKQA